MQVGQTAWSPPSNLTACSAALMTDRAVTAPSVISAIARSDASNVVVKSTAVGVRKITEHPSDVFGPPSEGIVEIL